MMNRSRPQFRHSRRGLSLVEVLVAVAICAGAVIAVVALFGPTERGLRDAADRRTAVRLVERVETELRRAGFTAVVAAVADGAELELVVRADGSQPVLAAGSLSAHCGEFRLRSAISALGSRGRRSRVRPQPASCWRCA